MFPPFVDVPHPNREVPLSPVRGFSFAYTEARPLRPWRMTLAAMLVGFMASQGSSNSLHLLVLEDAPHRMGTRGGCADYRRDDNPPS